ncbi:MAG: DUF2510 domain-containing protein [Eggerthellaceae bacterium]|nr:DUF2510 domain-containing protein [Eggerthellaceae bacterium]
MGKRMAPQGWYPDPAGDTAKLRYWDGAAWTASTCDVSMQPMQPAAPAPVAEDPTGDGCLMRLFANGRDAFLWPRFAPKVAKRGLSFSWMSLVLGPVYYVYRKCYLEAAVGTVLLVALDFGLARFPSVYFTFVNQIALLVSAAFGALFYPFYRRRARRAIAKAREAGLDDAALEGLRAKGGTSLRSLAILAAAVIVLLVVDLALYPYYP